MTSSRQDHVAFKYYIHRHQGLCSSYLGSISLRDSNQVNMKANNSGKLDWQKTPVKFILF